MTHHARYHRNDARNAVSWNWLHNTWKGNTEDKVVDSKFVFASVS